MILDIKNIDEFENQLNSKFAGCEDFIARRLVFQNAKGLVCCVKEMADKNYIAERIIKPMFLKGDYSGFDGNFDGLLQTTSVKSGDGIDEICFLLSTGSALVALDNGMLYYAV